MRKYNFYSSLFVGILCLTLIFPSFVFSEPPKSSMIVGTPACPKLNAHNKQACRFNKGRHSFQVWPNRIAILPTEDPKAWIITDIGNNDFMFDHTMKLRKDDHIAFQCVVRNDGQYYGPIGMRFKRGGVWKTYGEAITIGSAVVAGYFSGGTGAVLGGTAAETLGSTLSSTFGNTSWEVEAGRVAQDICKALAR